MLATRPHKELSDTQSPPISEKNKVMRRILIKVDRRKQKIYLLSWQFFLIMYSHKKWYTISSIVAFGCRVSKNQFWNRYNHKQEHLK